ncbi:hypothetical protein ACJ8S7_005101 [Klebsiella pneumoniae]|nr:hypothetical protein [Klebsiella pneumoniae]
MNLQKLLDKIKEVENQIRILENLKSGLSEKDESERCAGISYRGSWTVSFRASEVENLLKQRHDDLHVQLKRLFEAKKAAEITAEGWLNSSGGKSEQD